MMILLFVQESDNLSKKDELDELRKELEARKERLQIKSRVSQVKSSKTIKYAHF